MRGAESNVSPSSSSLLLSPTSKPSLSPSLSVLPSPSSTSNIPITPSFQIEEKLSFKCCLNKKFR